MTGIYINMCFIFCRYLRNVSIDDTPPVAFTEEGIITDYALKIVNVNPDHIWEEVRGT